MKKIHIGTVDDREVAKFEAMAEEWWNPVGKFRPLHRMNPVRLDYILKQIEFEFGIDRESGTPLTGLDILDMGCGGGLLSEPLARLGGNVLGTDVSGINVRIAETHAKASQLAITYREVSAEQLAEERHSFAIVLCMEVIEHVVDPEAFMMCCARLVRPGGLLICSTINRNAKSYIMAIVGAEYVLRWLPVGTHDWRRFIKPHELQEIAENAALDFVDKKGFVYNPLRDEWIISATDLDVNYVTTCRQPQSG
ncbi:MAG: bifunctional 2-polyprenyl-6-hydroxyphenol methylase/3-demethylubiquinol 3-O-methyltransferase UbiG [Rhodobacteraceae bacterium]|nr:bifunctional 2-polyprenyl-6-hydroxyphenol methylase/3-demethylubiquinol 3-O-methyltransferase UbiG [Paracoccaceae bacterium]